MVQESRYVVYRVRGKFVIPIDAKWGKTEILYEHGKYALFRSRVTSTWNAGLGRRVSTPSSYRVVVRMEPIMAIVRSRKVQCETAMVMRVVYVDANTWMKTRMELVEQVESLGRKSRDKRRKQW